jgi:molybdate transport system substrate-binding protein
VNTVPLGIKETAMKFSALTVAATVAFSVLVAPGADAAEVKLFVGGGFRAAATELAPAFERATGHKLVSTFDSAGGLERRIKAGEAFDVLLIGASTFDALGDKIAPAPRVDIARAGLGVAVKAGAPKPDVGSVDAVKRALVGAKSVAYVGEGHSGQYFLATLDRLGIGEAMKPKLKPLGVADVVKAGASGEAELVVYVVPALLADRGVELAGALPEELQSYVSLTAALGTESKEPDAAKALIAFLQSQAATPVIRAKGW